MSNGQEGDTRQFKHLKRSDYYELKRGDEVKPIDKWPKCKTCGQEITGVNFNGYCLRCKT
jgi:hypothetical protein